MSVLVGHTNCVIKWHFSYAEREQERMRRNVTLFRLSDEKNSEEKERERERGENRHRITLNLNGNCNWNCHQCQFVSYVCVSFVYVISVEKVVCFLTTSTLVQRFLLFFSDSSSSLLVTLCLCLCVCCMNSCPFSPGLQNVSCVYLDWRVVCTWMTFNVSCV